MCHTYSILKPIRHPIEMHFKRAVGITLFYSLYNKVNNAQLCLFVRTQTKLLAEHPIAMILLAEQSTEQSEDAMTGRNDICHDLIG